MSKEPQAHVTIETRMRNARALIADRTFGALADLMLFTAKRLIDEQPVLVQLTWHRADLDPVKTLSKALGTSEVNPSGDQGPHIEMAWCSLYLPRRSCQLVRVLPPVVSDARWDLVALVLTPGDGCLQYPGWKDKVTSKRLVLRAVSEEAKIMVARAEYGCARIEEKG